MRSFFDFTLDGLETEIGSLGKEKYRARQLYRWVYNQGIMDFSRMDNLPKSLRVVFSGMFSTFPLEAVEIRASADGSKKFGFLAGDGYLIESVLIPESDRNTLCLSTQVGCRMGCRFCVTGRIGFVRNLEVHEIVGQVMGVKEHIGEQRITNIVLMGMGEPMDNLEKVLTALEILKNPFGLDFSHRRITVSSVGLIDGLRRIGPKDAGIAISLNAADDATRTFLMPINRLYHVGDIVDFVKGYKGDRRTRITFEYVLVRDVNDSPEDAKKLACLLLGVKCKINLIPYNESPYIDFKAPQEGTVRRFQEYLLSKSFTTIVRDSRGTDVCGGCGQLGMKYLEERNSGPAANA
jgi:23S rRNA (adenine2503-C2)-methyltransferase